MPATLTLPLIDGTKVVVPDSLDLITPYVLQEQLDWFEDEIKFLRRLLTSGQKVIDIGANYGLYTVSMAKAVGPTGLVWAFEPASGTAAYLAQSIVANGFAHVTLDGRALSSSKGEATLSVNDNAELNALIRGAPTTATGAASETVALTTLDDCMATYGWQDIAFMKMDAEGEETNILKGGPRFFETQSPLVLYEIKAGADVNLNLVHEFKQLGYDSYVLAPGLDLLVPFSTTVPADGHLLNLFCCKPDCAARLAAQGALLTSLPDVPPEVQALPAEYGWRNVLCNLPYGAQLTQVWEKNAAAGQIAPVEAPLALYARSQDARLSAAERYGALTASYHAFSVLCEREASNLRLASLARVARDFGARSTATAALIQLSDTILRSNEVGFSEPFLAPHQRFDTVPPGDAVGNWAFASVQEALELTSEFSSYYSALKAKERLETIYDLGFGSAEMKRRLKLLYKRYHLL